MANIKEVAQLAGVSTATVSKYLNGVTVKEKNKESIDRAIKELNFRVNTIARGLRTNRSGTVGLLIPDLRFAFFTELISEIENALEEHGYSAIVCDYRSDPEIEEKKIRFLLDKQVDALIIAPVNTSADEGRDIDVPIIYLDQFIDEKPRDFILIDNARASAGAVSHLISMGHTRIGIINGPMSAYTARERLKGYYSAFCDAGQNVDTRYIKSGKFNVHSGYALTSELLDSEEPPTAILATNSDITTGAVIAVKERGLTIGKEISLVGFDNLEIARVLTPKLTIVMQPIAEIAKATVMTLMKRLSGEGEPGVTMLEAELVLQGSVADIRK